MLEIFKHLTDAAAERIRSPFLGSIAISFVGFNWQALFYLFFAEKPVRKRILYFNTNTDYNSLLWFPVTLGVLVAVFIPWMAWGGAMIARVPKARLHDLQYGEGQRKRTHATEQLVEEEDAIARLEASRENRQIDAAARLKNAGALSEELEQDLSKQRQFLITSDATGPTMNDLKKMSEADKSFVLLAASDEIGKFRLATAEVQFAALPDSSYIDLTHKRDRLRMKDLVEWLSEKGYTEKSIDPSSKGTDEFNVTRLGYELADLIEAEANL